MTLLLVKLKIGISTLIAVGIYYLAVAPPVRADVCGAGNYSDVCASDSGVTTTSSQDQSRLSAPYSTVDTTRPTSVPEPSTVVALVITGLGVVYSGRKRKQASIDR